MSWILLEILLYTSRGQRDHSSLAPVFLHVTLYLILKPGLLYLAALLLLLLTTTSDFLIPFFTLRFSVLLSV